MSIMMPYGEYGGKCGYCHGPDRRSISFGTIAHTIRRSNDGSVGLRAAKLRVDDFQELLDMYAKFAKINPLPLHFQEDGADLALGCTNRTTKLYFFLILLYYCLSLLTYQYNSCHSHQSCCILYVSRKLIIQLF